MKNISLGSIDCDICKLDETSFFPEMPADLGIVHYDLISHLTSPRETFIIINRILKLGGLHYFKIGNKGELLKKEQGEYGEVWGVLEHLYHFSRSNIKRLLSKTGFETKKIIIGAKIQKIIPKQKITNSSKISKNNIKTKTNPYFQIKTLIKYILYNPIIFPLYKFFRKNRIFWEKLGSFATWIIRPLSSNIWIYSIKK